MSRFALALLCTFTALPAAAVESGAGLNGAALSPLWVVPFAGILLSILLHELGHAFAGRLFNAHVSHIELTGLGGITHFERSLPASVLARSVIYLAGPAVNLGLWFAFEALTRQEPAAPLR